MFTVSIVSGSDVCAGVVYPCIDSPHTETALLHEASTSIPVPTRGTKRPHRNPIAGSLHSEHEEDYSDFESGTPVSASWPGEVYAQSPNVVPYSPQTPYGAKFPKASYVSIVDTFTPQHLSQSYQPAGLSNVGSEFDFSVQSQSFPPVAVTLPRYGAEVGPSDGGITTPPATIVRQQASVVRTCSNAAFTTQTRGSYAQSSTLGSVCFRRNNNPTSQRVQIPRSHSSSLPRPLRTAHGLYKSSPIATERVSTPVSPSLAFDVSALSLTCRERETPPMIKEEPSGDCDIVVPGPGQGVYSHLLDPGMFQHMMPGVNQSVHLHSQSAVSGVTAPLAASFSPLSVSPTVTPTGGTTPILRWSHTTGGGNTPEHQLLEDEMTLFLGRGQQIGICKSRL